MFETNPPIEQVVKGVLPHLREVQEKTGWYPVELVFHRQLKDGSTFETKFIVHPSTDRKVYQCTQGATYRRSLL